MCDKNVLLNEIDTMRTELMKLADEKGFTHNDTLNVSQNLDSLLNEYRTKSMSQD